MGEPGTRWFRKAGDLANTISLWFERFGLVAMAAMGLTTLIDVVGSKVLHRPLPGSTEITAMIQVVAIAAGFAYSKVDGRHIAVDFLPGWLPQRGNALLKFFHALLGLGLFAAASWMSYENGMSLLGSGTKTFLLGIPVAPFAFWVAIGCLLMCFVIVMELLASIERMVR